MINEFLNTTSFTAQYNKDTEEALRNELYFAYETILDAKIEIERLKEAKTQVDADNALILEM